MKKYNITQVTADSLNRQQLINDTKAFSGKKILVVGDVGVDDYVMGEVRRISPEAPVPVLEVQEEDTRLGLAANVAQNIQSLGGIPFTLSVVGNDEGAEVLKKMYQEKGLSWDYIFRDNSRPTTRKTRVLAKHHHIVRVDREVRRYLSSDAEKSVLQLFSEALLKVDGVILEDYAKGLVSPQLIRQIVKLCHDKKRPLFVDPHRNNLGSFYAGVDLIKPNFEEALALSKIDIDDLRPPEELVYAAGQKLQELTGAKQIVITRGKDGMTIFSGDQITEVPTYARKVFDVTGAGDTVIATMALALLGGHDLVKSCILANFAAGVVVAKVGCVPCTLPELHSHLSQ